MNHPIADPEMSAAKDGEFLIGGNCGPISVHPFAAKLTGHKRASQGL